MAELLLDSTFRNIVEEGYDAGVRLGESVEKDMIAVRIGPDWRLVAVASASYLAERGRPEHPRDLVRHRCINMRHETSGGLYAWEFEKDEQALRVRLDGQLTFNNSYAMIDAAVSGFGIAYVPESIVQMQLASGVLEQVLDDWSPAFDGYFSTIPAAARISRRSRSLSTPCGSALNKARMMQFEGYVLIYGCDVNSPGL